MPLISVIIPTHNRRGVLARALDSVTRQTHPEWELIVVDDGSTDDTWGFLQGWLAGQRQRLPQTIRLERTVNGGVSKARNLGVRLARGEWLAFLDSDDEWLPRKLELQAGLTPRFTLIHGEEIWIRRGARVNPMKKHAKSGGRIFSRCVDLCCVSPSTAMVNKQVFLNAGGFREDFPVCEDYALWLKIAARHEAGFIGTPLITKYGGHEDQLSLRYKAMDLFRVRALAAVLNEDSLTPVERCHAAETMLSKCDILLRGYEKHGNTSNVREVQDLREAARNALTEVQSTHSAAERLPRSESKLHL
jgi:glycosyltransferase involved in cell wall biosynthesis